MGTINVIAKWDLEKNTWNFNPSIIEYGRSCAIANYDLIINNEDSFNYIIIAQGSRVEDYSKDYKKIKETEVRIDKVIEHYKKCDGNYIIQLFLMDADAPIIEESKLIAKYIDSISISNNTNSVNIIGLSKCSAMSFYIPRFYQQSSSYLKTNIYNIATPYTGTKLASPLIFYPEVKQLITRKVGDNRLSNIIYNKLIELYEGISSNSHMDYDIAIPNGIPSSKFEVYDESFIKNIFSDSNTKSIKKIMSFKNIVTGIDNNTLKEAIKTMNFTGIGLCILDDLFFENKSDGMVYTKDQRIVEDILNIKSYKLKSSHHDVNSNIRVLNDVLSIVDDTIEESNEQ